MPTIQIFSTPKNTFSFKKTFYEDLLTLIYLLSYLSEWGKKEAKLYEFFNRR